MAFESLDVTGENSGPSSFPKMSPEEKFAQAKEQKKVRSFLQLFQDLPIGAYSLLERLLLISFDLNTFSVRPKRLLSFTPQASETYLIFDTVFKQAFFLQGLFDENQMRALQSSCESYFGTDFMWVATEPDHWTELQEQLIKQSHALKSNDNQLKKIHYLTSLEGENNKPECEINEDELRRKIQAFMNMEELVQFFHKSFNKIKELEEALRESIEEQSEEFAEEKRKQIKFKELLKIAIKEELAKERLLVEELKRRQYDSDSLS